MKCPHCNTGISLETEGSDIWQAEDYGQTKMGYDVSYGHCPECNKLIVLFRRGLAGMEMTGSIGPFLAMQQVKSEEIIYPKFVARKVEQEVPERYRKDYLEACAVLTLSPKASAALSRRILQDVIRDHFKIKHASLAAEIDEFIKRTDVPSYLSEAVDAVRNIGNFAAHPLKDTNTGEVVDVEPGEAEWLLDVLDTLFDHAFVQPKRLHDQRQKLNKRLQDLGKPPMKG